MSGDCHQTDLSKLELPTKFRSAIDQSLISLSAAPGV